ncbi:hypothetical protein ABW20_dc0107682 [Dactylellina cionopaga]|nr:hypothetical protein ABW20_dc0107682 [Dactylellina cionopaga]
MSSRALKKAQRQAELDRMAALAATPPPAQDGEADEDDEEEDEEEDAPVASKKPNLFAMLNAELEEVDAEEDEDDLDEETEAKPAAPATSSSKSKKKKKKKKGKGKGKVKEQGEDSNDDDFDSALAQALKSTTISSTDAAGPAVSSAPPSSQLHSLLHIDPRHLDLENEMRKLFGRAAASREAPTDTRQLPRGQRPPGGRPLVASGGRRNVFVQAGENWPREGSGGLSMELVEKNADDGTVLFRYVHSRAYQDVQRQFNECVRSMDPERMVTHLHSHPYHISTLLQTSHIALAQSNDPTTSQTLISRALFSLGRSSHSVFPTSLASGIARLSFAHFENRELYFAGWKYVLSLSRRGLWRTGLEFIRMLLQLDPLSDPLCLQLVIDQYALKSRAPQILIELAGSPLLKEGWQSGSPNILYSLSVAEFMAGNTDAAKTRLKDAVTRFPWMLTKLHGSLAVENSGGGNLPEGLWGSLPPSDLDGLLAEMYALRMGDLWNIPEHARFLVDAVKEMGDLKKVVKAGSVAGVYAGEKLRDLARHVFLMEPSEGRGLIGFLPKALRDDQGYAWDVMPPVGGESAYQKELESGVARGGIGGAEEGSDLGGGGLFEVFLRSLMPSFQAPPPPQGPVGGGAVNAAPAATPVPGAEGTFEVGEEDLQATLITMIEDGVGFPNGMGVRERAQLAINVGLVPLELRVWFSERFGVDATTGMDTPTDEQEEETPVVEEEEPVVEQERDSRAIDRLVQILGTGDRSTLQIRVDRMFEGQGQEMAEVRRRVEERLGLR